MIIRVTVDIRNTIDNLEKMRNTIKYVLRDSGNHIGNLIIKRITPTVPKLRGVLRREAYFHSEIMGDGVLVRIGYYSHHGVSREPYAIYQERGYGANGKPYTHYTTPGTGPRFLYKGLHNSEDIIRGELTKDLRRLNEW